MIDWLIQNIGTIVICAVLVCVVALIIRGMIKDKKQGKSSCGSSCCSCPMSGKCHPKANNEKQNSDRIL